MTEENVSTVKICQGACKWDWMARILLHNLMRLLILTIHFFPWSFSKVDLWKHISIPSHIRSVHVKKTKFEFTKFFSCFFFSFKFGFFFQKKKTKFEFGFFSPINLDFFWRKKKQIRKLYIVSIYLLTWFHHPTLPDILSTFPCNAIVNLAL